VLVVNQDDRQFGLVVDKILDVAESTVEIKSPATRAGVLYSAVVADRVTELLDIPAILRSAESAAQEPLEHAEALH
jgi:two-component system, chemotaxis family, sensor kinase CheA